MTNEPQKYEKKCLLEAIRGWYSTTQYIIFFSRPKIMKQILLSSQTLLMPRRRRSIPCQISRMTSRRTVIWVKSADAKFLYVASPETSSTLWLSLSNALLLVFSWFNFWQILQTGTSQYVSFFFFYADRRKMKCITLNLTFSGIDKDQWGQPEVNINRRLLECDCVMGSNKARNTPVRRLTRQ